MAKKDNAPEKPVLMRAKACINDGVNQYNPGDEFDCPESQVARLVKLGAAEVIEPPEDSGDPPADPPADNPPRGEQTPPEG